jgi:hypothetical protein
LVWVPTWRFQIKNPWSVYFIEPGKDILIFYLPLGMLKSVSLWAGWYTSWYGLYGHSIATSSRSRAEEKGKKQRGRNYFLKSHDSWNVDRKG